LLIKKLGYGGWKQLKYAGRKWIAKLSFPQSKECYVKIAMRGIDAHKMKCTTVMFDGDSVTGSFDFQTTR